MDGAIWHEKLEKLLPHVDPHGPVNLLEDPLLSVVITYGKSKLVIELMEKMSPVNLMVGNFNGNTALHVAVVKGYESVVEVLVEKNCHRLRARNKQLESPLHKVAQFGQKQIFWKLVDYGSNVYARMQDGGTIILHCAIMGNAPELALEIAMKYLELMTSWNEDAVMPLQLMVTIMNKDGMAELRVNMIVAQSSNTYMQFLLEPIFVHT